MRTECVRLGVGVSFVCLVVAAEPDYPSATLEQAFAEAGFDCAAPGAATFVLTADTHYDAKEGRLAVARPVIDEINAMATPPAFFAIVGDLIVNGSVCFGQVPGEAQKEIARDEFRALQKDLKSLRPEVTAHLVLGNHDTYPYERGAELFRSVFSERAPYGSFDVAGLHVVVLNGGHSGVIGPEQARWLARDVAGTEPEREVVLLVHQPALGNVVNERGIAPAVRKAFSGHRGRVHLVAGHAHRNASVVFRLPHTTVTQHTITTCNGEIWGSERPGYWVYCVREGGVVARIFRRFGKGYRLDRDPDLSRARDFREPFQDREDLPWRLLIGEDDDRKYLVTGQGGDCETYWFYVRTLVYRLPLTECGFEAANFAILASLRAGDKLARVDVSPDGEAWEGLTIPEARESVYTFPIPESCRAARSLQVRISRDAMSPVVAGFALGP